jgi:nicotinamidase-related amidase
MRLAREDSALLVIDIQEAFVDAIDEMQRVLRSTELLVRIANLLHVPVLSTVQNPARLGEIASPLRDLLPEPTPKMQFSAAANPALVERLRATGRRQVVITGIETHICVSQTAVDLLAQGLEVVVCPDAVSARSRERHKLGMERLRDSGVMPMHSEAVVYEWLGAADDADFREALKLVKQFA